MTDSLKPNQALFIWKRLTGATLEEREPAKSKAKPELKKDFQALLDKDLVVLEKRGKSNHVVLTNKAWEWAERNGALKMSRSAIASEVLEDLLNHLIPFLAEQNIPLASVLAPRAGGQAIAPEPRSATAPEPLSAQALWPDVEKACLALAGGRRKERVLLAKLRASMSSVSRATLDEALLLFQRQGKLVLYREDNSAALTSQDHAAALIVGDSPRHIVYLEN